MKDLAQLTSLCSICLTSTNFQQTKEVQLKLQHFLRSLNPNNLVQLFGSLDQSSLFVIVTILIQDIQFIKNPVQYLTKTLQFLSKCYSTTQSLVINSHNVQFHLLGKLKQWLGQLMKVTYYQMLMQDNKKQQMFTYFKSLNQQLRALSYISFIDAFSLIDHEIGFVRYRNLKNSFQIDWIAIMFEEVCERLKKMEADDQFQHLILGMEKGMVIKEGVSGLIPKEQEINLKRAESMIELFKCLTEFKYNIDYNEYEQGYQYDDIIHFPKFVSTIRNNLHFFASSFTTKLLKYFPQDSLTLKFLDCYIKISSIPSTHPNYYLQLIQTSTFMMSQNSSLSINCLLLDFNNRILRKITSFSNYFLDETNQTTVIKWIEVMLGNIGIVFKGCEVEFRNIHIDRIARVLNVLFRSSGKSEMKEYFQSFASIAHQSFMLFSQYLFSNNKCFLTSNVKDPQEMIRKTQDQFRKWMTTIFLSSLSNIQTLRIIQLKLFSQLSLSINSITNFNLLLCYIIKQHDHCFQQNIHYQQIPEQTKLIFCEILMSCYDLYTSPNTPKIDSVGYHSSVLFFFTEFTKAVIGSNIRRGDKEFMKMFLPGFVELKEKIIFDCINQILNKIAIGNVSIIEYSFQILFQITKHLFVNHQNKFFINSIHQSLYSSYLHIASTSLLSPHTSPSRQLLFRNISSLLSFSQKSCLISPLNHLLKVISSVPYQNQSTRLKSQIYDIKGLARGMVKICHLQQFVEVVKDVLGELNKRVFVEGEGKDKDVVQQTLGVYCCVFEIGLEEDSAGEALRVEMILQQVYLLILPHWIQILLTFLQRQPIIQKDLDIIILLTKSFYQYFIDQSITPHNTKYNFTYIFPLILASLTKSKHLLQKLFDQCESVILLYKSCCSMLREAIFEMGGEKEIEIFFQFHLFVYDLYLQYLNSLIDNRNNDQTSKHYYYINTIRQSMSSLFDYIFFRCLSIQPQLTFLIPNKIFTNIKFFISHSPTIINQLIHRFFKMLCITFNKQEQGEFFSHASAQLRNLTRTYPGSQKYVFERFQKEGGGAINMRDMLVLVYEMGKIGSCWREKEELNNLKEMERDWGWEDKEDVGEQDFEGVVRDWVMAIHDKPGDKEVDY